MTESRGGAGETGGVGAPESGLPAPAGDAQEPGGRRVLVVDDDPQLRALLDEVLTDEGYEVVTAPNGAAALELIGRWQPDAILLDLNMPVMDGREFVATYHQRRGPHAPVVLLTASGREVGVAKEIGAAGRVGKPFEFDDVLALVARLTGAAES